MLRQDIHTLFDRGYITIKEDNVIEVSRRIKEDYGNGKEYYAFHGKPLSNIPDKIVQTRDTLANRALKYLEPEVREITHSKCYDIKKIEESLDRLLDYCFDGRILLLYRKLCRYYYQIDLAAAVEYVNAYRDMWECG